MRTSLVLAVLAGIALAQQPPPDPRVRVEYTLKTARSRDPVLGGSREKVSFAVWIPDGVKTVRGAVCNPFSKDEAVGKHWQAVCRLWKFAYVQVDFDAVKKDEFGLLKTALADLAKTTGHPELETTPLFFTGMSRGGGMSMQLTEMMPERTIACVPVCLEVGPASEAARRVPTVTVFGEKDGKQMEILITKLPEQRRQDGRWAIAVQWGRGHEFGQANNLSFVFFDDVISRRLPKGPGPLADLPLDDGWLGDPATWARDGKRPTIQPARGVSAEERGKLCWFPSQRTAAVWQAFVSGTKDVTLRSPAGLGDGQAFAPHSAAKPVAVEVATTLKATRVELWDAHEKIAEKTEGPWTFEVTLKPGVHSLIATAVDAQGVRGSRPHTLVVE